MKIRIFSAVVNPSKNDWSSNQCQAMPTVILTWSSPEVVILHAKVELQSKNRPSHSKNPIDSGMNHVILLPAAALHFATIDCFTAPARPLTAAPSDLNVRIVPSLLRVAEMSSCQRLPKPRKILRLIHASITFQTWFIPSNLFGCLKTLETQPADPVLLAPKTAHYKPQFK